MLSMLGGNHSSLQAHSCGLFSEVSQPSSMPISMPITITTTTTTNNNVGQILLHAMTLPNTYWPLLAGCYPSLLQMPTAFPVSLPELSTFLQFPQIPILLTPLNKSMLLIAYPQLQKVIHCTQSYA